MARPMGGLWPVAQSTDLPSPFRTSPWRVRSIGSNDSLTSGEAITLPMQRVFQCLHVVDVPGRLPVLSSHRCGTSRHLATVAIEDEVWSGSWHASTPFQILNHGPGLWTPLGCFVKGWVRRGLVPAHGHLGAILAKHRAGVGHRGCYAEFRMLNGRPVRSRPRGDKVDASPAAGAAGRSAGGGAVPRSPSVEKALSILELLSTKSEGLRITEVAVALGLPKSSTYVALEALRTRGFVHREGSHYRLGLKVFEIAYRSINNSEIRQVAHAHLGRLSQATGLTSHLAMLDGNEVVYVDRVDGTGFVKFDTYVGKRASVHLTAVGKAIVAYLDEERLDEIIGATARRDTRRASARHGDFKSQLQQVRENGYAVDDEEDVPGVYCVGAPLRGAGGDQVIASIGVIGLKRDLSPHGLAQLGAQLRKIAQDVSRQLGYHGTWDGSALRP